MIIIGSSGGNIAMATETWNLFDMDLTQVCSCVALYTGFSPKKRGESPEELITCPMTYTMCGFDNQIIAHTSHSHH